MAKKFKKTLAMAMVMCMLVSMLPVQALAEETETTSIVTETQTLEGLDINLTVEGNKIVVEFAPTENAPAGDEPAGDEPAGDEPAGDEPAGDEPAGDEPAGDTPADDDSNITVVETPEGSVEWESNLTLDETVEVEVTDITVTTENSEVVNDEVTENESNADEGAADESNTDESTVEEDKAEDEEAATESITETTVETTTETTTETIIESENGEDETPSDDAGESEVEATPDKTTTEIVIESVTVETESTTEDGTVIEGTETVTEITTTVTDTFVETTTETTTDTTTETVVDENGNEIVTETVTESVTETETETVKESVTVETVVEGEETITGPVEKIAPGEEVPSVTVPIPGSDEINVEENVEGEVIETENEDGSTTTTQTNQTVTEEVDETTGAVTKTETITTTENVKAPADEQTEGSNVTVDTTTTTTIEKTTEETADGETSESIKVTVTVVEDVIEITGDVKEGEDDAEYDFTTTTETTEREVVVETVNNGVVAEDADTGLVGEKEHEIKGIVPVYDVIDGKKEDKGGMFDGQFNSGATSAYAKIENWDMPEGADVRYVGTGEHSKYYVACAYLEYEKDENDNTIFDENGKPIIKAIWRYRQGDTQVTVNGEPATELPKEIGLEIEMDNYGGSRPFIFMLMDEKGNRSYAYCSDLQTDTADGHYYSVSNLEDSNFYATEESEDHIRSIVMNGYWGTTDIPQEDGSYATGSLEGIKEKLRELITSGKAENEIIEIPVLDENGNPKVDEAGNPVVEAKTMMDAIDQFTEGEALLATQAAIWSYSNGHVNAMNGQDGSVIVDPDGIKWNSVDGNSKYGEVMSTLSSACVDFMYKWLIGLETEEESTVVINENHFVEDVNLTVHEKVEDETIVENYDEDDTNDVYNTDLNFRLAFIPGENDDLLVQVTYIDLDGNPVNIVRRLAGENAEGQTYEDIRPEEDGSYVLRGLKLSENENFDFDLRLEGTQYLEQGAYFYAPVGGRETSQSFVGIAEGDRNVDVTASMTIKFDVEESKSVSSTREWREETDPVTEKAPVKATVTTTITTTTKTNTTTTPPAEIPEEEVPQDELPEDYDPTPVMYRMTRGVGQLETIIDEEVPLAEVPQTGDNSILWFALIMLSVCGLWILHVSDKKCKA